VKYRILLLFIKGMIDLYSVNKCYRWYRTEKQRTDILLSGTCEVQNGRIQTQPDILQKRSRKSL